MKKSFWFYFIVLFYLLPMAIPLLQLLVPEDSMSNPFDYARITDVDYKAVLVDEPGSQGKVVVTERLTFDIHAAFQNNLFWELWRDLPEDYVDGVKVSYKVNSVKQILDDGTEIPYGKSRKLYWYDSDYRKGPYKWYHSEGPYNPDYDRYECVFFYVNGLYREKAIFEVEYEIYNAALRYSDCSELYLTMYSEATIKYLKSFKAQILIPDKDMPQVGNYEAHTFGTNSNSFRFIESDYTNDGYHTFLIDLHEEDLKFRPYNEYIEFTLISYGQDRHKFTDYASRNIYYDDVALEELMTEQKAYDEAPRKFMSVKIIVFVISLVISVFTLANHKIKKVKLESKYTFYSPSLQVKYFREIPSNIDPNFAASLVFCKEKKEKEAKDIYAALMLSLVRKKYISLEKKNPDIDWRPSNVNINVLAKPKSNIVSNTNDSSILDIITSENINYLLSNPSVHESLLDNIQSKDLQENNISNISNLEELTPCEEYYLNLIIKYAHDNTLTMGAFQTYVGSDYENTDSFVNKIKKSVVDIGVSKGYFQKAAYDEPKKYLLKKSKASLIIGIILLILVNLISYHTRLDLAFGAFTILGLAHIVNAIQLRKLSKDAILLTQLGEDEYAKWRGLYEFLNSQTLMDDKTVVDLPLWEQYLVYATAFGISEKVIKVLELKCPNIEISDSVMFNNTYYRSHHFYSSSRAFRSSVRSASRSAHSVSYGGGGRGGGGGGGGH